jgi:hypothetical protein
MVWLIFLLILGAAFYVLSRAANAVENQHPWQQSFDLKFSADEFYKAAEEAIKKREIPGISFSRVRYSEGGVLSANREYLHIARGEMAYDLCAAPFGTGFFVSSWYAEKPDLLKKLMRKIPMLASAAETRTYYQIDTDAMFKSFVHAGMLEAIDAMTEAKGARKLNEFERRMPNDQR